MKPIFILSLPRSGSTLLQRVLSTSNEIATTSEPWVALPICYMMKPEGESSEYGKEWEKIAFVDFFDEETKNIFHSAANGFLTSLYSSKCKNDENYFLDKTPRYHLIIDELLQIFPDAKFIILTRNPLDVVASTINTWGKKGAWNVHTLKIDIYNGVRNIASFLEKNTKEYSHLCISYEQLTNNTKDVTEKLEKFLDIKLDSDKLLEIGKVKIKGELGDPTGVSKYSAITPKKDNSWLVTLNGILRKIWVKKYLKCFTDKELGYFGVDKKDCLKELGNSKTQYYTVLSDVLRMLYGIIYTYLDLRHFLKKYRQGKVTKKVGYR